MHPASLFQRIALSIQGLWGFHMNFRIISSIFVKKGILVGICIESVDGFV